MARTAGCQAGCRRQRAPPPQHRCRRRPRPAPAASAAAAPAAAPRHPRLPPAPRSRSVDEAGFAHAHASPAVRRFARELGVDLAKVKGSGPEGAHPQGRHAGLRQDDAGAARGGNWRAASVSNVLPMPVVDFAKFGPIEAKPLSRIKKISGANLHRNWVIDSARHAERRSRHHRAGSLPQADVRRACRSRASASRCSPS